MRIEDIDDDAQRLREIIGQPIDGRLGGGIAPSRRGDLLQFLALAGCALVKRLEARPAQDRLDRPARAVDGCLLVRIQRHLPPLARHAVAAFENLAVHDDAAAHAGAEDDAEDGGITARAAEARLGQREEICVVRQHEIDARERFDLLLHSAPIEALGIRFLQGLRFRIDHAGRAHADAGGNRPAAFFAQHPADGVNLPVDVLVALVGPGLDPQSADRIFQPDRRIDDHAFHLRSAQVDAPKFCHRGGMRADCPALGKTISRADSSGRSSASM